MRDLGIFNAGDDVFIDVNFHDDSNTPADPTSPAARHRMPDDTFADLSAPVKLDSTTGWYGLTVDTTGFAAGQHEVRLSGTVSDHLVATVLSFRIAGQPAGTRQIVVYVEAPEDQVVPAAFVTIRDGEGLTILTSGITDSGGEVTFWLEDGDYLMYVSALARATFENPTELTVSADDDVEIVGEPFSPSGSPDVDECVVCVWLEGGLDLGTITARLSPSPQQQGVAILREAVTATWQTDHYELILARESTWSIKLPPDVGGDEVEYTVPDAASANLEI